MNLGKAIKKFRKERNISQSDLCREAGISLTFLSQIENGRNKPSQDTMEKISEVLGVPVAIIQFYGIEETDIAKNKRSQFKDIFPMVDNLLKDLYTDEH